MPQMYSNKDLFNLLLTYGECHKNAIKKISRENDNRTNRAEFKKLSYIFF